MEIRPKKPSVSTAKVTSIVITCVILVAVLIVALQSFAIVPAGHTGVRVRLGEVSDRVLPEGLHFKAPFIETVVNINNRVQLVEMSADAVTSDLQRIDSEIAVNFRILGDRSAFVFQEIQGNVAETILLPAIQESVKAVTALYPADDIIMRRTEVSLSMQQQLAQRVSPFGLDVSSFNIVDFQFGPEFSAAIEAKQAAQQDAQRAENVLEMVRIDAQQRVAQADAEAEAIRLRAEAEAEAVRIRAEAEAFAIQQIQEQLRNDPLYIEYMKVAAWDGRLPVVSSGDSSGLILDVSGIATTNIPPSPPPPPPTDE